MIGTQTIRNEQELNASKRKRSLVAGVNKYNATIPSSKSRYINIKQKPLSKRDLHRLEVKERLGK